MAQGVVPAQGGLLHIIIKFLLINNIKVSVKLNILENIKIIELTNNGTLLLF